MCHLSMIKNGMEVEFIKGILNEATNWASFEYAAGSYMVF